MSRTIGYKISYVFGDMNTALGWGGGGGGGGRTSGSWFLQKVEDPAPSLKTYCFSSSQYHLERLFMCKVCWVLGTAWSVSECL